MSNFMCAVIISVFCVPAVSSYWRPWVNMQMLAQLKESFAWFQKSPFCGQFSALTISQGIKWVLEDSPGGTNNVTVVFFDRPHFPKKALLLLNIDPVKKQLQVKNYAGTGPEVLAGNIPLPNTFSQNVILTGQEPKLSFWFPQDDIIIFVSCNARFFIFTTNECQNVSSWCWFLFVHVKRVKTSVGLTQKLLRFLYYSWLFSATWQCVWEGDDAGGKVQDLAGA